MRIRPATPADAAAIAAIYAPYVAEGTVSFETEPVDAGTIAGRMAAGGCLYPWLVAETAGAVSGYAYAGEFSPRQAYRWTVETTIYLAMGGHRRGVGRHLYAALLETLATQGFAQAIGRISLPNAPSVGLHRALGFVEAGVLREVGRKADRWIDVAYWQRPLRTADEPVEPAPAGIRFD